MKGLVRGVGLLGTSLGLALTEIGVEVFLEDVDARAVATATGMGAGSGQPCEDPDLVFVAVPPQALAHEVAAALRRFPNATVNYWGGERRKLAEQEAAKIIQHDDWMERLAVQSLLFSCELGMTAERLGYEEE